MTARPHCLHPDACRAKSAGHCRSCWGTAACAVINSNEATVKAAGARMRLLLANPAFLKARAKHMLATNRRRAANAILALGVPSCAEDEYRRARRVGFSIEEAVSIARSHAVVIAGREARG